MAKKKKPIGIDGTVVSNTAQISVENMSMSKILESANTDNIVSNKTADIINEKLERADIIDTENSKLINENEELKNKLTDYIIEIQELKEQLSQLQTVACNQNTTTGQNSDEIKNLNDKINELTELNDNYLNRISELSFENSKLNYLIKHTTDLNNIKPTDSTNITQKTSQKNVYRYIMNGYSDWN